MHLIYANDMRRDMHLIYFAHIDINILTAVCYSVLLNTL